MTKIKNPNHSHPFLVGPPTLFFILKPMQTINKIIFTILYSLLVGARNPFGVGNYLELKITFAIYFLSVSLGFDVYDALVLEHIEAEGKVLANL
jgi:hypothetical protein